MVTDIGPRETGLDIDGSGNLQPKEVAVAIIGHHLDGIDIGHIRRTDTNALIDPRQSCATETS